MPSKINLIFQLNGSDVWILGRGYINKQNSIEFCDFTEQFPLKTKPVII